MQTYTYTNTQIAATNIHTYIQTNKHPSIYKRTVAFKDLVRRTFNLKLSGKDCGALVSHFDKTGERNVDCQEFLTVFLQLGYQQRSQLSSEQLAKQRSEDEARVKHNEMLLKKTTERGDGLKINTNYKDSDAVSAEAKMLKAAKGYDKTHPAAPSLDAWDIAVMPPGTFISLYLFISLS